MEYDDSQKVKERNQEIEEDNKLEILKRMIKSNCPIEDIVKYTGYTEKEIINIIETIDLIKKILENKNWFNQLHSKFIMLYIIKLYQ